MDGTVAEALPRWTGKLRARERRTGSLETPRFMVRETSHPRKTFLNDTMNSILPPT